MSVPRIVKKENFDTKLTAVKNDSFDYVVNKGKIGSLRNPGAYSWKDKIKN